MGLFPETIAASLGGAKVQAAALVLFDFTSKTMRLWRGEGSLNTRDGHAWAGLGALGNVTGIEQAVNGEAPEAVFTLSGVDQEVVTKARDELKTEVLGRRSFVYLQFFGEPDADDPDNQRTLDLPYPIWCGRMLTPAFTYGQDGERSIAISAESMFSLRSRPRHALYTDRDQQRRFLGDRGFEFVGNLVSKVVTWPDY